MKILSDQTYVALDVDEDVDEDVREDVQPPSAGL